MTDNNTKTKERKKPLNYTKELLDSIMERDEAVLLIDYDKYTRNIDVQFMCKCGEPAIKMFRYLVENAGARCPDCSVVVKTQKYEEACTKIYGVPYVMQTDTVKKHTRNQLVTFTRERLNEFVTKENLIGEYDENTINRETDITFLCSTCGTQHTKTYRMIVEYCGAICKKCTDDVKQEKIKASLMEQFGVEYSLQVPEFSKKAHDAGCNTREFQFPSGKIVSVQGYEPLALELLVMQDYDENDIITSRKQVPEIWWTDDEGKKHRYFIDIYIKNDNRLIEVKSDYRYKLDKYKLDYVWKICVEMGYNYEVWIFNKREELIDIIHYQPSTSSSSGSTSASS